MATPGILVETMAEALGLPDATVTQYDRQLSENGLRSKVGRGSSAARVTARDAANLLIAVMASPVAGPSIKIASVTCATYGNLIERSSASWRAPFASLGLPALGGLPAGHTLIEALTVLIASAGRGEVFSVPDRREGLEADFAFSVEFDGPQPWAQIFADGSLGEARSSKKARLVYSPGGDRDLKPSNTGDLHQKRSVTFKTIRKLAAALQEADATKRGRVII